MTFLVLVLALAIGLVFGLARRYPALRVVGALLTALFAVGCSAATVLLWKVGSHARWTSDGPGMLLVMVVLALAAIGALVGWSALYSQLTDEPPDDLPPAL